MRVSTRLSHICRLRNASKLGLSILTEYGPRKKHWRAPVFPPAQAALTIPCLIASLFRQNIANGRLLFCDRLSSGPSASMGLRMNDFSRRTMRRLRASIPVIALTLVITGCFPMRFTVRPGVSGVVYDSQTGALLVGAEVFFSKAPYTFYHFTNQTV